MSTLQYRGSIALAAVAVALLSSRTADAQVFVDPGPPRQPVPLANALVIGVWYDAANQAHAEHQLEHAQAKGYDARCIDNLRYRIAVDDWLIRKNSLQCTGYYPVRPVCLPCDKKCCALQPQNCPLVVPAPAPGPGPAPGPMAAAPTIPITIVNADPAGAGVDFAINGVAHQAAGGSRQDLSVAPASYISYDGGGSLGQRRYVISPGTYEFRSTAEGRALYKLSGAP